MTHRAGFPRIPARSAQRGAPPTRLTARVMAPPMARPWAPPPDGPPDGPPHRLRDLYGSLSALLRISRQPTRLGSKGPYLWPGGSSRGEWMFAVVIRVSITSNKGKRPRIVIPESSGSECGVGEKTTVRSSL